MPGYDGSGNFELRHDFTADAAAGIKIRADRMDAQFDDIATALSSVLTRDGQAAATGDIPFGGNKATGLADPTEDQDAATKAYIDEHYAPGWVTVKQYGAVGNGTTDDTTAFTNAIAAAAAANGGVYVPPGQYRLTDAVEISSGVRMVGAGFDFDLRRVSGPSDVTGSVIICDFGTATADHLLRMRGCAALTDVCLYSAVAEEEDRPSSWSPTQTPWAIVAGVFGESNTTNNDSEIYVDNVLILEFTHGIRCRGQGGARSIIRNVKSNAFDVGVEADGLGGVLRLEDCHFKPWGGEDTDQSGGTFAGWQDDEKSYTLNNGTAFRFGHLDGLFLTRCFSLGYQVGVEFYPSEDDGGGVLSDKTGEAAAKARILGCYFDSGQTGIKITSGFDSGQRPDVIVSDTSFQTYNAADHASVFGAPLPQIDVDDDVTFLSFVNCHLSAGFYTRPGKYVEVADGVSGQLSFTGCWTAEWDEDDDGVAAFDAGSTARINLHNHHFLDSSRDRYTGTKLKWAGDVWIDGRQSYDFTPTLVPATEGTFSLGASQQAGRVVFRDDGWFDLYLRLVFTPTVGTASGALLLDSSAIAAAGGDTLADLFNARMDLVAAEVVEGPVAVLANFDVPAAMRTAALRVATDKLTIILSSDAATNTVLTAAHLRDGEAHQINVAFSGIYKDAP